MFTLLQRDPYNGNRFTMTLVGNGIRLTDGNVYFQDGFYDYEKSTFFGKLGTVMLFFKKRDRDALIIIPFDLIIPDALLFMFSKLSKVKNLSR